MREESVESVESARQTSVTATQAWLQISCKLAANSPGQVIRAQNQIDLPILVRNLPAAAPTHCALPVMCPDLNLPVSILLSSRPSRTSSMRPSPRFPLINCYPIIRHILHILPFHLGILLRNKRPLHLGSRKTGPEARHHDHAHLPQPAPSSNSTGLFIPTPQDVQRRRAEINFLWRKQSVSSPASGINSVLSSFS